MTTLSRRQVLAGLAGAAGVAAAGVGIALVGGGGGEAAAPTTTRRPPRTTTTTSQPTTTTAPPLLAPLTGLPWALDPALVTRPALVVKVSNADGARASLQARPQSGINEADVVVEALTEGGVTRFVCVYHSADVEEVGPVRSFRTTELDLLPALGLPLFAYSGANADFLRRLRESGRVVDVGIDGARGAYRRVEGRSQDQSLMTSTPALFAAANGRGTPPPPWFSYRAAVGEPPGAGARPVAGVDHFFGGGVGAVPVTYRWDGIAWARTQKGTPHTDTVGRQVAPANVVYEFVPYVDTGGRDTSGASVPEGVVVGDGEAWVFTDGQVVVGRWWKPDPATPTQLTDAAGAPIRLTPGETWVALAPAGTATIVG